MTGIFTIGHSVQSLKSFIQKLHESQINILVDVRTKPYSNRTSCFNREILLKALMNYGIKYIFRGNNLGGLRENTDFNQAINELIMLSQKYNVVIMCSEGDFRKCHRYLTLTPELESKGIIVKHISWSKSIQQSLL